MGIAILKDGKVIVVLQGAKVSELADHIRNGYPEFLPVLPSLTAVEYADDALPPSDPPPPPTQEETAAKERIVVREAVFGVLPDIVLDFENRLRNLEGKEAVAEIPIVSKKFTAIVK